MTSGRREIAVAALFLGAPTPNPAAAGSSIMFRLGRLEYVRLAIVDATGRRVRTLHEGMLPPGEHTRRWDGTTDRSGDVAPGVYFITLESSAEA
ncbi:MAG TPA: FlgD immunoglobulin-like domain containing protein [Candidatus Limnocylindria bacterium]|nr:FlgD immunoglobulin-like domain containing protein [Candidatus Limnocylindria bacterium]